MLTTTSLGETHWSNPSNVNAQPSSQVSYTKDGKNNDDPYMCSVCDFVTVYKVRVLDTVSSKRHYRHSALQDILG